MDIVLDLRIESIGKGASSSCVGIGGAKLQYPIDLAQIDSLREICNDLLAKDSLADNISKTHSVIIANGWKAYGIDQRMEGEIINGLSLEVPKGTLIAEKKDNGDLLWNLPDIFSLNDIIIKIHNRYNTENPIEKTTEYE